MNRVRRRFFTVTLALALLALASVWAFALPTAEGVTVTDVNTAGFSVVWRSAQAATPSISVFSDPEGLVEVTGALEVTGFPVVSGDPAQADPYYARGAREELALAAKALGNLKVTVAGCAPGTTYYFKVTSTDGLGGEASFPEAGLLAATTGIENSFISDSRLMFLDATYQGVPVANGWLVLATVEGASAPVTAWVGDGAPATGALVNFGAAFGADGFNLNPTGLKNVSLVFWGAPGGPSSKSMEVDFGSGFAVASFERVAFSLGDVNQPPVISAIGAKSVNEGETLSFTVSASDPEGAAITYGATGLPTGATFDTATGVFSWTPGVSGAGGYEVVFTATDGIDTASEIVAITVANVNLAPVLTPIGAKSVNEGETLTFAISAVDPDGGTITYAATGLPTGATFDSPTGVFSWTPDTTGAGAYELIFTASDGADTSSETVAITVVNVNISPVADAGSDSSVAEGATVTLNGGGSSDPDGSIVSYSWAKTSGPAVTISAFNSSLASFTAPQVDPSGTVIVLTLTVTDNEGKTASDSVTVTVTNVNRPPAPGTVKVTTTQNESVTTAIDPKDPDTGDTHTFALSTAPAHGTATLAAGGSVTYIPNSGFAGSDAFSVAVADQGGLSATASVEVTVTPIVIPTPEPTIITGETIKPDPIKSFTFARVVLLADVDGDDLLEMIVGDGESEGIFIFRSDGKGGFGLPARHAVAGVVIALAAGDVNGDGLIDIIVLSVVAPQGRVSGAGGASYQLSSLLGSSGGGYDASTVFATGNVAPYQPATADLDGDGKDEVIATGMDDATDAAQDIIVYSYTDTGGSSYALSPLLTIAAANPGPPLVNDFNGDGKPDVAVADKLSDTVTVAINGGSGSFTQTSVVSAPTSEGSLAAGDFNGDGKSDLAVTGGNAGDVEIMLWNNAESALVLAATYVSEGAPTEVIARDFNGDSKLDIAVIEDSKSLKVLLGTGTGTFSAAMVKTMEVGVVLSSLAAGDMNGDGKLDIAAVDKTSGKVVTFQTGVPIVLPPAKPKGGGGGGGGCFVDSLIR